MFLFLYMSKILSMKKLIIINGVNLGELGTREIDLYGARTFDDYFKELQIKFSEFELHYFQTDHLGILVEKILQSKTLDGIIINPGAYTHTSIVIADAIKAISIPVVEVHISNLSSREQYRKNSFITSACLGSVSGFGLKSYEMAIKFFED